jgi:hypothetical protein
MPENAYNELNQMKPRKSENIIKYFQEYLSAALGAVSKLIIGKEKIFLSLLKHCHTGFPRRNGGIRTKYSAM